MNRIVLLFFVSLFLLSACGDLQAPQDSPEHPAGEAAQEKTAHAEWFYDHFDAKQRDAYDAFRKAAEDPFREEPVPILSRQGETEQLTVSELDSVYQGFLYDHPELFYLDRSYRYRVCGTGNEGPDAEGPDAEGPDVEGAGGEESADGVLVIPLTGSTEEIGQQNDRLLDAAQELLTGAGMPGSGAADPGVIYDRLARHAAYTEEALYDPSFVNEHTAYGALVQKSAVCDGYALALKYLMDLCGVECIVVPGTVNGAPHVWNMAFWDGRWHEMDITWDASSGKERQYFDLTTEEMNRDHEREPDAGSMIPVSSAGIKVRAGTQML